MTKPSRLIAAVLASLPAVALAHGAFPLAYDVHEVDGPAGPELRIESNFGVIRPVDGGWRLLCEEAVSPGVKWFQLDRGGRIFMGSGAGLHTSDDRCVFTPARDSSVTVRWLERVTVTGEPKPWLVALLDFYVPGRNLQLSRDDGASVEAFAAPDTFLVNAIRADPFAADVLHATAQVGQGKYAYVRHDFADGSWTEPLAIDAPGIARVVGATATAVFVRVSSPESPALFRIPKGGGDPEKVLDLAKGSDAATALFAPLSDALYVGNAFEVPQRSTDDGLTWSPSDLPESVTCLRDFGDRRFACIFDANGGPPVLEHTAAGWTPVLQWNAIVGMEECPETSEVGRACPDLWDIVAPMLDVAPTPSPEPPDDTPEPCGTCASTGLVPGSLAALLGLRRSRRTRRTA